jgi:hypothetical protein
MALRFCRFFRDGRNKPIANRPFSRRAEMPDRQEACTQDCLYIGEKIPEDKSNFVTVHKVAKSDALQTTNCKRLQGAANARRRARRRTFVLQVPDNKADAVHCKRLPNFNNGRFR